MKARVAFFMLPEPGHILPSLRVAKSLQAGGCAVSYVSIPGLEGYFERLGFSAQTILRGVLRGRAAQDVLDASAGVEVQQAVFSHLRTANASLGDLLAPELRAVEGDILVCDAVIMKGCGDELCDALRIPVVSLSVIFPDAVARERIHVPNIILCPREFELPQILEAGEADPYTRYAEPSIFRGRVPSRFPWDEVPLERRLAYCSLGTQSLRYPGGLAVLQAIIEAFAGTPDLHLVMCVGSALERLQTGPVPSNVLLVRTAPQLELLDCASLFITHGGLGGLKESVMSGVPALVIPFDRDQPGNAERVERHRVGVSCLPSACTPETIRDLARTALDDGEIRAGVSRMRRIFRTREMQRRAARLISEAVRSEPIALAQAT